MEVSRHLNEGEDHWSDCTVTEDLDERSIIEQDVDLVRKGRDLEEIVLARAVRRLIKMAVYGRKTVVFD